MDILNKVFQYYDEHGKVPDIEFFRELKQEENKDSHNEFGCTLDLEPYQEPDGCVIDKGRIEDCCVASSTRCTKETCPYWKEKTGYRVRVVSFVSAQPGVVVNKFTELLDCERFYAKDVLFGKQTLYLEKEMMQRFEENVSPYCGLHIEEV